MTFLRLPLIYRCVALLAALAGLWLRQGAAVAPVVVGALILAELIAIREVLEVHAGLGLASIFAPRDRR